MQEISLNKLSLTFIYVIVSIIILFYVCSQKLTLVPRLFDIICLIPHRVYFPFFFLIFFFSYGENI